MDGKLGTFLLGVIAAVVLVMLWRKESGQYSGVGYPPFLPQAPGNGAGSGCSSGCASGAAAPVFQSMLADNYGLGGQISPGTPPLNAVTGGQGATSFYSDAATTPDTSFTFIPVQRNTSSVGSNVQPVSPNVPGSPTTPAAVTPVRATQPVPMYTETGWVNHYNFVGIPRAVLNTGQVN